MTDNPRPAPHDEYDHLRESAAAARLDAHQCPGCGSWNLPPRERFEAPHDPAYHLVTRTPPGPSTPECGGCGHAPHWRECRAVDCYCRRRGPHGTAR